jgi:hypothetical protein
MTKKKEQKVHEGLFCIHGWEESRCQSLSIWSTYSVQSQSIVGSYCEYQNTDYKIYKERGAGGCSSMVENLPSMCKALGLIPRIARKQSKTNKKKNHL